jgi:hypothetical protein
MAVIELPFFSALTNRAISFFARSRVTRLGGWHAEASCRDLPPDNFALFGPGGGGERDCGGNRWNRQPPMGQLVNNAQKVEWVRETLRRSAESSDFCTRVRKHPSAFGR